METKTKKNKANNKQKNFKIPGENDRYEDVLLQELDDLLNDSEEYRLG